MATHSSVLAWRIPGMGKPSWLPSMGSHRVRHNWSDLAAAGNMQKRFIQCVCVDVSGCVYGGMLVAQLCPTLCDPMDWALQAPLSMEFSRQDYWSGEPFPFPGDFSVPGIELWSPTLQMSPYHLSQQGSPYTTWLGRFYSRYTGWLNTQKLISVNQQINRLRKNHMIISINM